MGSPVTEVYRGTMEKKRLTRGIEQCEGLWSLEKNESLDTLIAKQLNLASQNGDASVTLIDIGSGLGGLISELADELQAGPESQSNLPLSSTALQQSPDLKIHILGLTDARNENDFAGKVVFDTGNPQISATNVFYSLTKDQTFADFLASQNVSSIHLALGTWSFAYFHPFLFRDTIKTVVDALNPQGEFIAAKYDGVWGDKLSIYSGNKRTEKETGSIERFVRSALDSFHDQTCIETDRLLAEYETLLKKFAPVLSRHAHTLTPISEYTHPRNPYSPRDVAMNLFSDAEELRYVVRGVKLHQINQIKRAQLWELEKEYEGQAAFTLMDGDFRVMKF